MGSSNLKSGAGSRNITENNMSSTIIRNATIVDGSREFAGSVLIDNGIIVKIFKEKDENIHANNEIDATGMMLLPGVIDEHVHFRDPGYTQKADTASESRAAVAGGVTSYMDMPNTNPPTTTLETLEAKFENAAQHSLANYSYYFGATNNNASLLPSIDKTNVCGVKLFMGSSTGNMLVDSESALRSIFDGTDMLIATHCEDSSIISAQTRKFKEQYGENVPVEMHPLIRNEEACYRSSALAVELADKYGSRLHIMHISTARELTLLSDNPMKDKLITAEACVAHLLFDDSDYARLGARIKCNPAIKTKVDRDALRHALLTGRVDTIATDHAPHLLSEKEGGATKAVSGMPMLQFSLVTMLDMAKDGILTYADVVNKMCNAPADLYHIDRRGYVKEGYYADLVLVEKAAWTLTADQIISKCKWSPLEGHTFSHRVVKTFVNGEIVYDCGKINENIRGKRLKFNY